MPEYRVSIIVQGEDRASGPLGNVGNALGGIGTIAGGILTAGLIERIASGILGLGRTALDSYANFERLGLSLQSLVARELVQTGQAKDVTSAMDAAGGKAKELQGWIQKLAIQSPFKQEDVAASFRQAMAYGFTADEAKRLTQATIDFASGSGASAGSMNTIALALGQIKAKGHVAGQEVLQLVNAGLPVTQILAKGFGVTTGQLQKMIEKGLVPADKAIEILTESLETDFGGSAKRQAETFSGLISSLSDIKDVGLREFFSGVFEAAKPLITEVVNVLSSPEFMAGLHQAGEEMAQFLMPIIVFGGQVIGWMQDFSDELNGVNTNGSILLSVLTTLFGPETTAQIVGFLSTLMEGFHNLSDFWSVNGDTIKFAVMQFGATVGQIFTTLASEVIPWLVEMFNHITAWVNDNGPLIAAFAAGFLAAMTNIIGAAANMWQFIEPLLTGLINIILDVAKTILQVATGDWPGAWNTIQQIVQDAWTAIKGFFMGFVNWVLQTFVGSNLKEFVALWTANLHTMQAIAQGVIDKVTGFFDGLKRTISGVVGSVVSLIEHLKEIVFPSLPSWAERNSPAPIEQTFGNWLTYAKGVKETLGSMSFPNMGQMSLQPATASVSNQREYNLYLSTTQSPAVVQQSFDLLRVLDAA